MQGRIVEKWSYCNDFFYKLAGAALGFKIHGAKATKWPKPDQKFGSYLAQGLKISKIHGAIAPLALP